MTQKEILEYALTGVSKEIDKTPSHQETILTKLYKDKETIKSKIASEELMERLGINKYVGK